MDDVVLDDAVEDVASDEAKFAINGGKCTLGIRPIALFVVRRFGVGVMEICDCNCAVVSSHFFGSFSRDSSQLTNPVIHPQIREPVQQESVSHT